VTVAKRAVLLTILLGVPFALFLALAEDVAERQVFAWDTDILRWAADLRAPALDGLMQVVTDLGATLTLTVAVLALTAVLLRKRLHREALFVALSVGGAAILNALLKQLFQRPRPDVVTPVVTAHGFAFPSGHTMSSMAFACVVALLWWHLGWRYRWPVSLGALAIATLVGASRVYLGVHYPSDVLAGWLVSLDLVAVVYLLLLHIRPAGEAAAGDRAVRREPQVTTPGGDHGGQP
jgi:membrane-associated phospholipid phosphatase